MTRLIWCLLLIGGPHLFFATPEAVLISAVVGWAFWSVVAVDRDYWRQVAAMRRRPTRAHVADDSAGTAPHLARKPIPQQAPGGADHQRRAAIRRIEGGPLR